ncbi:Protein mono-ADP-ribosyltransferase PARP12 [Frankliniella fusca]|uniref:Poly [ADP-ribose] polymerase n=1 Tax=Frankliniella fusca TaxID=407009 RepID=A0AAE1H4K6_9NEOP|nr:Protein mono-ADP-ribosyltransferase PARP12 [Frankliniella fusca]
MAIVERVSLPMESDEYREVEQLFEESNTKGFRIKSIDKVHNYELLQQFENKKEWYLETYGHVRVVKVFHGTRKDNVSSILRSNFDLDRSGSHIGHRFGVGVSFSAQSRYASHYCDDIGEKTMLLCKVLVSEIKEVPEVRNPIFVSRQPPEIPGREPLRYDTTAKNKEIMDVIVKYHMHSYYPTHVITFQ